MIFKEDFVDLFVCVCVFIYQTDLEELLTDWSEDKSVGNVILKYVSSLQSSVQIIP